MLRLPTLASLLLLAVPQVVFSSPCVVFDASFNLITFGLNGKDWNAGTQGSWTSGSAQDITASGRPPFDGSNTTCYMAQFFNTIYILNGDAANPSDVHIYDAGAKSWSTQTTTTGGFSPASFDAILDHDTNVFYAVSNGEMYFLDMSTLKAATSSPLPWTDVGKTPYDPTYQPVMALAQNHIHFLDVPGTPTGDAQIFVIHFSFFQPTPQAYPIAGGGTFPAQHGQATSFFQTSDVQQEFAFLPDDGSATYVINVETNTTQSLAGPTSKDPKAIYAASITALVQLDSTGAVSFLPYTEGDASANANAAWTKVAAIAAAAPPSSSSSPTSSGANSTAVASGHPSSTGSGSAKPTGSTSQSNTTSSAVGTSNTGTGAMVVLCGLFSVFACLL
ncbi:hypothetical protein EUX98_g1640 [Antrodiella citrinella]|uniref:Uncharacterized protein n=1 Tax=Antrodiella citrinella TaxID=2447956 RepID=A0A4S4N0Y9_9APHY|nr:hypothetical protein EUX98_g1640 [Antrodiella citrinella]